MGNETIEKFSIKNPRWLFYLSVVFTTVTLNIVVILTVLFCVGIINFLGFIIPTSIVVLFFILSAFCSFGYLREKFIFENEAFIYVNIFGKKQAVKIEDLSSVNFIFYGFVKVKDFNYIKLYSKGYVQIEIIDNDGKVALKFSDYFGTVFKNGLFGSVLTQRNIQVKEFFKE